MDQPRGFTIQDRFDCLGGKADNGEHENRIKRICRTLLTSGVQSRTPNPVPPVVMIQSMSPCLAHEAIVSRMRTTSSGTIAYTSHEYFG